jgi:hypothetical protein
MDDQRPKADGYVRSDTMHKDTRWTFAQADAGSPDIILVGVETAEGPIHIALSKSEALDVERKLKASLHVK